MAIKHFRYSSSPFRTSQVALITTFALSPAGGMLFMMDWSQLPDIESYSELYRKEDGSLDINMIMMPLMALVFGVVMIAQARTRLQVGPSHLAVRIPKSSALGFSDLTTGNHRIPFEQIRSLKLKPEHSAKQLPQALQKSRLEVVTDQKTYRFQPFHFRLQGGEDHRLGIRDFFSSKKGERLLPLLESAPLVRSLADTTGQPVNIDEPETFTLPESQSYNLLKHKGMAGLLAAMAGIGCYAGIDYALLVDYIIVGELPLWPFVSAGLLAAAAGAVFSRGAPAFERLGVSALLTVTAVIATWPALERYTLTMSPDPISATYHTESTGLFTHEEYPTIDQRESKIPDYWKSVEEGQPYPFTLHHPVLGFWLVDMGPVYEKSRAFYRKTD